MVRVSAYALAFFLALAGSARADWTLVTADGPEQTHLAVNTWNVGEGLSVTDQAGRLVKVDSRNIVSLTSDHTTVAASNAWRLTLRNGDTLLGQPAGISGQSLSFVLPETGAVDVPLKALLSLAAPKAALPSAHESGENAEKDVVHLNNGDTMEGIIAGVSADKIQLATGAEVGNAVATDIALNLVECINFAGATIPRTVPPLGARITFLSGTTLTVPLQNGQDFAWSISEVTLADPVGVKHSVSSDQILSIEVLGGRAVSLMELDPVEEQQASFLGTHWPVGINKTAMGRPLTVAKTVYPRGLGVHTRSRLAYDLDGSFDTLKLRAALDDSAAPRGEADVSILIDGKVVWQRANMNVGESQLSEELSLPIKGGKRLELRADPPKNRGGLDILGRVDWISPVLMRP